MLADAERSIRLGDLAISDELRILVFGGRTYPHSAFVHEELFKLTDGIPFNRVTIIHGDANRKKKIGADYYAHTFCEQWRHEGIIEEPYPAKWGDITVPGAVVRRHPTGENYNVVAGFIRNQEMLDKGKPTHALGFPGGNGTDDMRRRIERANDSGARIVFKMIAY
jgi:hypothetical protein